MAVKKPLVLTSGRVQQLQSGDDISGSAGFARRTITRTNANAGSVVIGQVVYLTSSTHFDLCKTNILGTATAVGLVAQTSIGSGDPGLIIVAGILTATTTQWDAVTGETGGLVALQRCYASDAVAGKLAIDTLPSSGYVTRLGYALTETDYLIIPNPPVPV